MKILLNKLPPKTKAALYSVAPSFYKKYEDSMYMYSSCIIRMLESRFVMTDEILGELFAFIYGDKTD